MSEERDWWKDRNWSPVGRPMEAESGEEGTRTQLENDIFRMSSTIAKHNSIVLIRLIPAAGGFSTYTQQVGIVTCERKCKCQVSKERKCMRQEEKNSNESNQNNCKKSMVIKGRKRREQ